jgi:CHAT domain-containing protein/Tfp pilus assembly protein PilF
MLPPGGIRLMKTYFLILLITGFVSFGFGRNTPVSTLPVKLTAQIKIADSLFNCGLYEKALRGYEIVLKPLEISGQWSNYLYAINRVGYIYSAVGTLRDAKKAENIFRTALNLCKEKFPGESPELSDTYYCSGFYEISSDSSLHCFEMSLKIRKKIFGENHLETAESYFGLGERYRRLRDYNKAWSFLKKCQDIRESILDKDDPLLAELYFSLASAYRGMYDFENALIYIGKTIEYYEKPEFKFHPRLISSYSIRANVYIQLEKDQLAVESYKSAINQYIKLNGRKGDNLALFYKNLAVPLMHLKRFGDALSALDNAYDIAMKYDQDLITEIINVRGLVYANEGEFRKAEKEYKNTLKILDRLDPGKNYDKSLLFEDWGDLNISRKSYDSALVFYQQALVQMIPDFNINNIYVNPARISVLDNPRLYDLVYKKAKAFRMLSARNSGDRKDLDAALELYRLAVHLGDTLRNKDIRDESQLFLDTYFRFDFEQGIDCAYELWKLTGDENYLPDIFDFMERAKYRLILQAQKNAEKEGSFNVPGKLRTEQSRLIAEISDSKRLLQEQEQNPSPAPAVRSRLINDYFDRVRQQELLKLKIKAACPECGKIRSDSTLLGFNECREHLKTDGLALIEYYCGLKTIYVLGLTGKSHSLNKINMDSLYLREENIFLNSISGQGFADLKANYHQYVESASYLYKILAEPVLNELSSKGKIIKNLLVIPDGSIAFIPFEALLTDRQARDYVDFKTLNYLIRNYQIGYGYSSNLRFKPPAADIQKKTRGLIAFSYSDEKSLKMTGSRDMRPELPGTSEEIERITKAAKGVKTCYQGTDATESRFKSDAPYYDVIHLAIHGIADTVNYLNSRLIFRHEKDSLDDGFLYASELYGLDLSHVKLAVLSACESGIGKSYAGEGMFSVARGFVYAGCPSLVMSLWKVNDFKTARFMGMFYENLAMGQKVDEALRNAKLGFIESTDEIGAHPANWAAFVGLGKLSTVFNDYSITILIWIIVLILIISYIVHHSIKRKYWIFSPKTNKKTLLGQL